MRSFPASPQLLSLLVLGLVCAGPWGCSASKPSSRESAAPRSVADLTTELLEISGTNTMLSQIRPSMEQQFTRVVGNDANRDSMLAALQEGFATPTLQQGVHGFFVQHTQPAHLRDCLAWMKGALGQRVLRAEEQAGRPESVGDQQAYLATLSVNPPPQSRVTLLQQIDGASGSTDLVVESVAASFKPLLLVEAIRQRGLAPSTYAEVNQAMERMKAGIRQKMEPAMFQHMLFAYRDLGEGDLAEYLRFYQGPAGQWFAATVRGATASVLEEGGKRFVNRLAGSPATTL